MNVRLREPGQARELAFRELAVIAPEPQIAEHEGEQRGEGQRPLKRDDKRS